MSWRLLGEQVEETHEGDTVIPAGQHLNCNMFDYKAVALAKGTKTK